MHAAPPVRMSLAPDRAWQCAAALCAGAAGANLAAWGALHAQIPVPMVVAISLTAAGVALLWTRWGAERGATTGVLVCDGGRRQWSPVTAASVAVELRLMIDLGPWFLLRFTPTQPVQPAARWAASRRRAGAAWPLWRTALHARRPGGNQAPAPEPK